MNPATAETRAAGQPAVERHPVRPLPTVAPARIPAVATGSAAAVAANRPQRVDGRGELALSAAGDLARLYQHGAARIRLPACHHGTPEAVLMNTAGGLTGGDQLHWGVDLAAGTRLLVTSAACEKIYRSTGETATVSVTMRVDHGASLEWLPQESICFEGGRVERRIQADLYGDATLLVLESWQFGRQARAERLQCFSCCERWELRRDGDLVHAEAMRLDDPAALDNAALLAGHCCLSTLVFCNVDSDQLQAQRRDQLRAVLAGDEGVVAGVSVLPGRLVLRLLCADNLRQRRALQVVLASLRGGRSLPRVWCC